MELPLQRERVEREVDAFVDDQVVKHDDQRWGNRLSSKLFVAREFVVKHVRNKHVHVVDAERSRIQDAVYYENFRAFREEQQRRQREDEERAMQEALAAGGPAALFAQRGGGGRGRGRGRGGRGGMAGGMTLMDGSGGAMMVDPSAALLMADPSMMMGAPILMPTAAGGMAPVIMAPLEMMVPMAALGGAPAGRGGRGGRGRGGGRGGGHGGFGFGVAGGGAPAGPYFDLDAPQNNRAVLDYGDL